MIESTKKLTFFYFFLFLNHFPLAGLQNFKRISDFLDFLVRAGLGRYGVIRSGVSLVRAGLRRYGVSSSGVYLVRASLRGYGGIGFGVFLFRAS